MEDPLTFLTTRQCDLLWNRFRFAWAPAEQLLKDKLQFHRHFARVPGIRLPRLLGHNKRGTFIFPDEQVVSIETEGDIQCVLDRLFNDIRAHSGDSLFIKEQEGKRGQGAFKVWEHTPARKLHEAIQNRDFVFEQTVVQHPTLAAIAPETLNTLRVTTLRRSHDEAELASVWLKLGRSGQVTDTAPGMLMVGVDSTSGRLAPQAWTRFEEGGKAFTRHPDTGHELKGVQIPRYNEAVEMALAASRRVEYPIVGWDIGLATDGPVLLEGNGFSNYKSDQTANGVGYLDHPVLGAYIREQLDIAIREEPVTIRRLRAIREAAAQP